MTKNTPENSPLSATQVTYSSEYNPNLLYPIKRSEKRHEIGIDANTPMHGLDRWTCYEISWLQENGCPIVGLLSIDVPASSPCIVESKSLKLYLNSFNQTHFQNTAMVETCLIKDLSNACGSPITISLQTSNQFVSQQTHNWPSANLDRSDIAIHCYQPNATDLKTSEHRVKDEVLCSHLLKSNCLVTGQPDWGSVWISYSGAQIKRDSLLRYIVSFREHNEFHEQCVERLFHDILQYCSPDKLSVYAAYTRRGGIEIAPFRSTDPLEIPPNIRHSRQ